MLTHVGWNNISDTVYIKKKRLEKEGQMKMIFKVPSNIQPTRRSNQKSFCRVNDKYVV